MSRYKASTNISEIGHSCCYNAAVVDTTKPYHYREGTFESVCECADKATAIMIANALNAREALQ